MNIPKTYDPSKTEKKWYDEWLKKDIFHSKRDEREPYTIVIPPPNVTGVLHMGHMLNNTLQDVLVRRARMKGLNACWLPGTDHASIATEAKVVEKLREKGIDKKELTREEFIKHAWDWTESHGGIILEQLKKLGASCDWKRTRFTMEPALSKAVTKVFVDLYNKGYIYRGVRMINWDPKALTALSDEEVIYKEVNSKLYYLRYRIEGKKEQWIHIATTRPETILGDTAVCVHPDDDRYQHLIGEKAVVPLINRPVPVIADPYVDMEFGTGALKITPAHDLHDYEIGIKHGLQVIDIMHDDGTLNEKAGLYVGEDRFKVREKIENDLKVQGYLIKVEDLLNKVGCSERTGAVIEPRLSMQWFCKMNQLARPALENVMNDHIRFYPSKFKNVYRHWMKNIKDWCISRQLWWGHRIPVWYCTNPSCREVLIVSEETPDTCPECRGRDSLYRDEDVLDTWFSSWLWPISVFDGFENEKDIAYYYPTSDLVTAPDIIFFWVARMIMAGYEYRGERPFKNVYFTGMVRDQLGRKMSKSLGNSPEPLELMDKYGADGVRVGLLLCSPAGNDLLFKESLCEQGRNFCNKLWNAFRLIQMLQPSDEIQQPEVSKLAIKWFSSKLSRAVQEIEKLYADFKISDVLMTCYRLVWEDFCSWYLEIIKPVSKQSTKGQLHMDRDSHTATTEMFEILLKLLHPFMPFITEEIWHLIEHKDKAAYITVSAWPVPSDYDNKMIRDFEYYKEVVTHIRNFRNSYGISPKKEINLYIREQHKENESFHEMLTKLCTLCNIDYLSEKPDDAYSFIVKANEYFIPLEKDIKIEEQLKKLNADLNYMQGFYNSVMKKLANKNFTDNAPDEIVEKEKIKRDDALARIKVLREHIAALAQKKTR